MVEHLFGITICTYKTLQTILTQLNFNFWLKTHKKPEYRVFVSGRVMRLFLNHKTIVINGNKENQFVFGEIFFFFKIYV